MRAMGLLGAVGNGKYKPRVEEAAAASASQSAPRGNVAAGGGASKISREAGNPEIYLKKPPKSQASKQASKTLVSDSWLK